MTTSYNITDLPFNIEGSEPAPTKEQHSLFETRSRTASIASSLSSARPSTVRFRGKPILLLGLGICISIILLCAGLGIQIFVANEYAHQGLDIITTASLGSTLAIFWVLAVFLLLTIPLVVGLDGYRLAWAWLEASADNGHNRPTPFQLGLIMNLLHGANLSALCGGLKYMYGICTLTKPSYKPPILRRVLFILALALGLVYSFEILVIVLSISSKTMSISQLRDYPGTWPQLSRQINSSMCATTNGAVAQSINLCGLQNPGASPFSGSLPEALRTLTNNSATNAVAFGNDGTAFLVPASIPMDAAYYGTSVGVISVCQSITDQCVGSGPAYGPTEYLAFSCPSSVSFNAALNTTTGTYPFGILDSTGNEYGTPYLVDSNPFRFGAVAVSDAYSSPADTFAGNTGFFTHGSAGAFNVLTCSVTVRNVTYMYHNGIFTIDPSRTVLASDLDITRGIGAMTSAAYLSMRVPAAVDGAGLAGGDYASAFARELSRELIAFTASAYASAAPLDLQIVVPILGSRFPLVLLVLILAWLVAYCALVLFLTISAVLASSASPYTLLARSRLADPLTAVHTAYGRAEAHRTWERSAQRLFSVETGLDRLSVGPTTSSAGGLAFGVSRAVVAPSSIPSI
ncbi:hypothetical protein DFH08DRAFT_1079265 [Mycena albidolilacea]|uniref:Uncharacterized protein n=1 Tax=Mycena albidolilacea TaxID=1033008 RepID=A0AAD7ETC9_9AGAR|nr:hypothetical protein DFH08DRAFT_1079265 [Mycena albidolilacea]